MEYHQLFKEDPIINCIRDHIKIRSFIISLTPKDEHKTTYPDHEILNVNFIDKRGYYNYLESVRDELVYMGFPDGHPIFQKCYDILYYFCDLLSNQ